MKGLSTLNFFCVGFFITAIQLNLSWTVNYIIKLIGMLFIFGGVCEMGEYSRKFKGFSNPVKNLTALSAVAAIVFAVLGIIQPHKTVKNILGIVIGGILILITLFVQKQILDTIAEDRDIVNDLSEVRRLKDVWVKLAFFTLGSLVFNIFNLVPVKLLADISGVGMAVSRIVMYIMAIVMLWRFNSVRVDYYKKRGQ